MPEKVEILDALKRLVQQYGLNSVDDVWKEYRKTHRRTYRSAEGKRQEAFSLYRQGIARKEIATRLGLSRNRIWQYIKEMERRERWREIKERAKASESVSNG